MEVQGERKDEDRGPSYEGGYLYSDICRTWDRTGHIAAFHVFSKKGGAVLFCWVMKDIPII